MIEIPRSYKKLTSATIEDMQYHTKNVPPQQTLAAEISENFTELRNGRLRQNNASTGVKYIASIISGLIRFGVDPNAIETELIIVPDKQVTMDIAVWGSGGLLSLGAEAKASIRERGKLADRIAMALQTFYSKEAERILGISGDVPFGLLFHSERPAANCKINKGRKENFIVCCCSLCAAKATERALQEQGVMIAKRAYVKSTMDQAGMNKLLALCTFSSASSDVYLNVSEPLLNGPQPSFL
jgi:hypothetical protein